MKKIIRQIVREFWLQTLIAIAWATYRVWPLSLSVSAEFVANVAGAFFLSSWAIGQFIRIKRQQKIEQEFAHLKNELQDLLESIKKQSRYLVGHTTGGDSYGFFTPNHLFGTTTIAFSFINNSEFPVFDVFAEWIDLDEAIDFAAGKLWTRHPIRIGTIHPSKVAMHVFGFEMKNRAKLNINIFLQTRNGGGAQEVRIVKIDGQFKYAVKTELSNYKKTTVSRDFPGYDEKNPDAIFREGASATKA